MRVPFRISFAGGGSDYPEYFKNNGGGSVISTTINKYCYISLRELPPFFEHKHHIVYSVIEAIRNIDEIHHPSVRECFRFMNIDKGLELHHDGDLPARSGIGSSSAFTVGLLHALYTLLGKEVGKSQLAKDAIHVEQDMIREVVGCQDQIACAFGGFNRISFWEDGSFTVNPIGLKSNAIKAVESSLMLVFTGFPHLASDIASSYKFDAKVELQTMRDLVVEVNKSLAKGDVCELGRLINESWRIKKRLSQNISTPYIDYVYERAVKAGACGGKLIGAGGGGFMMLIVEPEKQNSVKESLRGLLFVPIKFEEEGSHVVFSNGGK